MLLQDTLIIKSLSSLTGEPPKKKNAYFCSITAPPSEHIWTAASKQTQINIKILFIFVKCFMLSSPLQLSLSSSNITLTTGIRHTENCLGKIKKQIDSMNASFTSSGCSVQQRHRMLDPLVENDAHLVTHKHRQCDKTIQCVSAQWVCDLRNMIVIRDDTSTTRAAHQSKKGLAWKKSNNNDPITTECFFN